jgi:hypothetical protein
MFDLTKNDLSVAAEAGYEFELTLPTGEPTGAFVTVRGEQSPAVKAYGRKMFNIYQQKQKMAKRKGKDTDDIDLDEAEDMQIETALVRMIGWKGLAEGKTAVEFNPENAKRILRQHPWIREEVMEQSSNLHNFR